MKFLVKLDSDNRIIAYQITNMAVEGYVELTDPNEISLAMEHLQNIRMVNEKVIYDSPQVTKDELYKHLAHCRWEATESGTTWNGFFVETNFASQMKYTMEAQAISFGFRVSGSPWKFQHGIEFITNEEMLDLIRTVRSWILNCYGAETEIRKLIENGSVTTKEEVETELKERLFG